MSGRVIERNIQENRYAVLGPGPAHSLWGLQKYWIDWVWRKGGKWCSVMCSRIYSIKTLWGRGHISNQCFHPNLIAGTENPHVLIMGGRGLTEQMALCSRTSFIGFCRKLCYFCLVQWRKSCISIFPQSIPLFRMPTSSYIFRFLLSVCLYLERISAHALTVARESGSSRFQQSLIAQLWKTVLTSVGWITTVERLISSY